jgi:tetratricopeptide (TPR) repeat protein
MKFLKILAFLGIGVFTFSASLSAQPSINDYNQAIADSPEDMKYKFYLLRGKAYKDAGEIDLALKDLNTSILLDPSRTAYKYRGELYMQKERYPDAVNDFTAALEINPSIELYKLRGVSYLGSENHVLALADGFNIIEMAPYDSESYYISMDALENLGDIKLARQLAFKVISFDRGNKKANQMVVKYPLKFIFIGDSPFIRYTTQESTIHGEQANEVFLKYKRGENIDENLKKKLVECVEIGDELKAYQTQLKATWNKYFDEVRALKIRSRKIHDDLRNKYQELSGAIEHEILVWEDKSNDCTEELVQLYWSIE